jgi:DNA-binding response OmpR family regulator
MPDRPLAGLPVILVEDDDDSREILEIALTAEGASVRTASGAEEALALFKAAPPAIVLTDLSLSDRDGVWLLRQIRGLPGAAGVPVIAWTGRAFPHEREAIAAAGFDMHLVKPVDVHEMVAAITALTNIGGDDGDGASARRAPER